MSDEYRRLEEALGRPLSGSERGALHRIEGALQDRDSGLPRIGRYAEVANDRPADRPREPTPEDSPESILEEAQRLVHGERGESYGPPTEDFTRCGRIWGALLDKWRHSDQPDVPPELVALCMAGLKLNREVYHPKRDNRVDLAGYAECADWIVRDLSGDD